MQVINLSKSGLNVSRLSLGMWRIHTISHEELNKMLNTALDSGITTFDHADIYGGYTCENAFGPWMKANSNLRDRIQLVSKCGIKLISENRPAHKLKSYDTSKEHIMHSVENSLKALNTEYLDLLLIHRPDPLMNPEVVAETFSELKNAGKVLHFGVSNFSKTQFELLSDACDVPIVTNQIEISLFQHDAIFDGTLDFLQLKKIHPMAWSPLGGANNINAALNNERLKEIAAGYQLSVGDLLLCWLLKHPSGIIPVIGTMNADRIKSAADSVEQEFSTEDWFTILEEIRGHSVA